MNIVLCIKQVPATTKVDLDPEKGTLKRQGVETAVNPHDLYAMEAALSLRDKVGGKVTVITMGPPQAEDALREILAYGADDAILVTDRAFAGADTWATAVTLAATIKKLPSVDIIICGKQAIDGDTAQVGPELAELLNIPHVCYVSKIIFDTNKRFCIERLTEFGHETVDVISPCLITVSKEIGEYRVQSLRSKLGSKTIDIPQMNCSDIGLDATQVGLDGSFTQVKKVFPPPKRDTGRMLSGRPEDIVDELLKELKIMGVSTSCSN